MRYILRPGWVRSEHDGSMHWVYAHKLIELYKLREVGKEYVIDQPGIWPEQGDRVLYPDSSGEYKL